MMDKNHEATPVNIAKGFCLLLLAAIAGAGVGLALAWVPAALATGATWPSAWPVGIQFAVYAFATLGAVKTAQGAVAGAQRRKHAAALASAMTKSGSAKKGEAAGKGDIVSGMKPGESWPGGG